MLWAMPMLTQKVQVRCRGKGNSPPEAIRHLSQLQGSSMKEQLLPQEIIRRKRDGYSLTVEEPGPIPGGADSPHRRHGTVR
jgi:hypothetical protein